MKPADREDESAKVHGDKLEHPSKDDANKASSSHSDAIDLLEIPPPEAPQTDGGTKIHGDKLDPHSGKKLS